MKSIDKKQEAPQDDQFSWLDEIDGLGFDGGMTDEMDEMFQHLEKPKSTDIKEGSHIKDVAEIDVYVHASSASKYMGGHFGLTDKQEEKLEGYLKRQEDAANGVLDSNNKPIKKLPPSYANELVELVDKRDNPKLGKSIETYVKEYLVAASYGIEKNTDSKYTNHGIANEPHSISLLNKVTGQKFVKCNETKVNEELLLKGTADIDSDAVNAVIDIKNPHEVFTFDRNRDFEITDVPTGDNNLDKAQKEYYDQMQAYMVLYDRPVAYLVYTLNENDYMAGDEYDEFGVLDRFIIKKVFRDPNWEIEYRRRLPAFKEMVLDAKIRHKESVVITAGYLMELTNEESIRK